MHLVFSPCFSTENSSSLISIKAAVEREFVIRIHALCLNFFRLSLQFLFVRVGGRLSCRTLHRSHRRRPCRRGVVYATFTDIEMRILKAAVVGAAAFEMSN